MSRLERDLLGWALGALEPGDALAMEEDLGADPGHRFHLAGLAALAGAPPPEVPRAEAGWRPPLLLREPGPPRIGERIALDFAPGVRPEEARGAIFRDAGGGWELLHPLPGSAWPTLDRFRPVLLPREVPARRANPEPSSTGTSGGSSGPEGGSRGETLSVSPPLDAGDGRRVDLVLDGPAGRHRYLLVALPAAVFDEVYPPGDERWAAVVRAAEGGGLPAAVVEVEVGG